MPAHFRLVQHLEKNPKPYQELKRARASKGKDRRPASSRAGNSQLDPTSSSEMDIGGSQPLDREGEDEFELEKAYLDAYIGQSCKSFESKADLA